MYVKQISRSLVIGGSLLICAIKFLMRPLHLWPEAGFFLGIAPNLFGSFLLPFAVYWFFNGRQNRLALFFRLQTTADLNQVCIMGFGMLLVNEYLQLVPVFGRTFDYYDILSSLAGLMASWLLFTRLQPGKAISI
jgi:hypothetical protein